MKRGRVSFYSIIFLISFLFISSVIAQGAPGLARQIQQPTGQQAPMSTDGQTVGGAFFGFLADTVVKLFQSGPVSIPNLTRILLGILLWMVIYSIVSQVGLFQSQQSTIIFPAVIALIFTLLTFIYLPPEFLIAIAIPYAGAGATILTFLPFIIVVYFTVWVTESVILARLIWIVFEMYYFILLIYLIAIQPTTTFADAFWIALPFFIMILIGAFIFWQLRNVRLWVFQNRIEEAEERGSRLVRRAGAGARTLAGAADELGRGQGRRR